MTTYSHSRIGTYNNCKRQFAFRYLEKAKKDFDTSAEAAVGTAVHTVLEELYKQVKLARVPEFKELLDYFPTAWSNSWKGNVKIVKEGTEQDYKNKAAIFIEKYYRTHYPFKQNVVGIETRIHLPLTEKHSMIGFIDRLDLENDSFIIHDYKTSSSLPTQSQIDDDKQLALYALAIRRQHPNSKVKLVWHYLAFDKILESQRTPEQLEELKQELIKKVEEIENTKEFPPNVTRLCDWCQYRSSCPAWKHEFKIEEEEINALDAKNYVDKLTELDFQKKEINNKIEELKEKILNYALKNDYSAVMGSEKKANLREKITYSLNEGKEKELFKELEKQGLNFEIFKPNVMSLTKHVKELNQETKNLLKKKTNVNISLSKL